jgi:hypothetical protein
MSGGEWQPGPPAFGPPTGPPPAGPPHLGPPNPGPPWVGPPTAWPPVAQPFHVGPPRERYVPGVGLAVAIAGLVIVALSLFVLEWADGEGSTFWKLSEAVRDAGGDGIDTVIATYAGFAGFVLFGLAAICVLLAGVPIPATRGGATYNAIIGTVICGGAAVYHAAAVTRAFRGPASPEIGAWLGVVGYFVIVVGMVIGARRVAA